MPRQRVDVAGQNLPLFLRRRLREAALLVSRLSGRLAQRSPQSLLAARRGAHAALAARLPDLIRRQHQDKRQRLTVASDRLARAMTARTALEARRLQTDAARLEGLGRRLGAAMAARKSDKAGRLESLAKLLASLSYRSVLERGFAVVRDRDGTPLMRAAAVPAGAGLTIEFADGALPAVAAGGTGQAPAPHQHRQPPAPAPPRSPPARGGKPAGGAPRARSSRPFPPAGYGRDCPATGLLACPAAAKRPCSPGI